ncbi:hypothetical protein D3C71_848450 [compost metagenome]
MADRVHGVGELHHLSVDAQRAPVGLLQAKQQTRQLGAARAQQPRQAHHLARADLQVQRLQLRVLPQALGLQQRGLSAVHGGRWCGLLRRCGQVAAQHGCDQCLWAQVLRQPLAHPAAVAQHGDAVGHGIDLVQEMRHEHDGQPLAAQAPQHLEELLHLVVVQAGGGLIEDEHARLNAQRAGNGDQLLHGHRVVRQQARHVDLQADACHQLTRTLVQRGPVDAKALCQSAARVAARKDVLGHREVGAEVDLLVHGADAQALRRQRRVGPHGFTAQLHLAAAGLQHTRQHLDQRGLARTVLPHQRMDLAGVEVELHITQHGDARKLLVDARKLQHRRGSGGVSGGRVHGGHHALFLL